MKNHDLFPIGTIIQFRGYPGLVGRITGHRMTRVVVQTTLPLPHTMPIGTLVFDDFTVATNPTLLRQI